MCVHFEPTVLVLSIPLSVRAASKAVVQTLLVYLIRKPYLRAVIQTKDLGVCYKYVSVSLFRYIFTLFGILVKHLPASASPVAGQGSAANI